MYISRLKITCITVLILLLTGLNSFPEIEPPVRIKFDMNSQRIDLLTGEKLPDYQYAKRNSFRFFMERLDEPEEVIHYFHDGPRTVNIEVLSSMEKFNKRYTQWKLRFKKGKGRRDLPQYIPRVHTRAVSFIPLTEAAGEPERRVHLLLDDLELIEWGDED